MNRGQILLLRVPRNLYYIVHPLTVQLGVLSICPLLSIEGIVCDSGGSIDGSMHPANQAFPGRLLSAVGQG